MRSCRFAVHHVMPTCLIAPRLHPGVTTSSIALVKECQVSPLAIKRSLAWRFEDVKVDKVGTFRVGALHKAHDTANLGYST